MSNLGIRAGTEAARKYEEYRQNQKVPDQVNELTYDRVMLKLFRIIMCCLVIGIPVLAYLMWDSSGKGYSRDLLFIYEFGILYTFITVIFVYQYVRMRKWKMVRTGTAIELYTLFHKRKISYAELTEAAANKPIRQVEKGLRLAAKGSDLLIPTIDMVPNGMNFCMQLTRDLHIRMPMIRNYRRRRSLRAFGYLTVMLPLVLGNMYLFAENRERAAGLLIFVAITGVAALGLIVASFLIDA